MAGFYGRSAVQLRRELSAAMPRETLRGLHERVPARHLAVAVRQFLLLGACTWILVASPRPVVVVPLVLLQGLTIFNFTVLLHEVVHHLVFRRRRPRAERLLALLYAVPSGLSASQFGRWHLDHHAELGSSDADPKRHRLSPKVNLRWFKLLYATPALFAMYFRAARLEAASYPVPLQRRIRAERAAALAVQFGALGALWGLAGAGAALRAYLVPVFFVFPIAFTLNRLGQHYDVDPADPAKWTTLVRGHWFWDFVFLNSNYHLEHHYFPGVPFYRLPALQEALLPFYERRGMRWQTYGGLLRGWLVENRAPHTNWAA